MEKRDLTDTKDCIPYLCQGYTLQYNQVPLDGSTSAAIIEGISGSTTV